MYWRNSWWLKESYPSCNEIHLPEGMLISHNLYSPVLHIARGIYHQQCYKGVIPMMNTNLGLVIDKSSQALPIVEESWYDFTRHNHRGSFAYSVVSIIYAISISFVIIWFLTLFVLTNYTIKPSLLMKASTTLSSIYITVVVIKSTIVLHVQQRDGYLYGAKLLDDINNNLAINIIDLLVVFLLQISQVQVIMRIFPRQKDKRSTFYIGIIASMASQIIWAVARFKHFEVIDEAGNILPAFIYLVRIVMGLCYAAIFTIFLLTKIYYIIANRSIWFLSILTFILIYSPVAFYVADVSNAFVYELSEIFSVVTYVICVVIPWEWFNKFNMIQKAKEKEGVLGRRFYEDELYELDRFELFVEQDMENDTGSSSPTNSHTTDPTKSNQNSIETACESLHQTKANQFISLLRSTKQAFVNLTDDIIAAGFAIPRSVSISTNSIEHQKNSHLDGLNTELNERTLSNDNNNSHDAPLATENSQAIGRNRRNVYVYTRKEVVLDMSDGE